MINFTTTAVRWTADLEGEWLCIRTGKARSVLDQIEQGKVYDVEIKQHRERRSLDANAYAWVLMDKLAEKTGIAKTEIYRSLIKEIGGNSDTVCVLEKAADKLMLGWAKNGTGWISDKGESKIPGCVNVTLYFGSSTYDTKQMSRLIDLLVLDCKEQGIETKTPFELDALKERWDAPTD